jgi:hypothetical protein
MRERPVVLSGRFTRHEEQLIEKEAEKQDMTVAEYVRTAVIMAMVLDGNLEAMKLVAGRAAEMIVERFRRAVRKPVAE